VIRHVVLMKFADPADAPEAKRRLDALSGRVPGLLSIDVGLDVLGAEGSYDLAVVTTHPSAQDLDAYQVHPEHQDFKAWVGSRLTGRAAVDSEQ
jgi:hypothetical protein